MNGTIELTPDQLAGLVSAVFEANGYQAYGLALHDEAGQLVGYAKAVVHYRADEALKVYPKPTMSREDMERMLNAGTGSAPAFSR